MWYRANRGQSPGVAAAAGLLLLGWRGGDKGKSRDGSEIKGRFVTVHSIPFFFFEECFIFTCISYPTKLDICACDGGLIHLMFLTVFSGRPVTSLKNGYMTHTHIWPLLFVLTDKKRGISLKKSCVP